MKKHILYGWSALVMALTMALSFTACSNDDLDTNQYTGGVSLNVWGPNPVVRGGTLRFLGSNLDQIASIIIPGAGEITNIEVVQSGVPSEIRITVPKEDGYVDYVKLVTNTGDTIVTKTKIAYTEDIVVDSIMPEAVMAGDTITITGDYLNLIQMVEFADGVRVSADDFITHDRYTIQVVVPDEAQTGKLNLYTADLTKEETEGDVSYNIITTGQALEVGLPTITKISSPRGEAEALGDVTIKAGETLTITGEHFNLIESITFGEGNNTVTVDDFTVSDDGTTITVTLPDEAPDGDINLVCTSGVEVPVGTITTVKPSECVASPIPVKAGQKLTITGKDMDLVYGVGFTMTKDVEFGFTTTETTVVIDAVPATAKGDTLLLSMPNGTSVPVYFKLVEPVVTGYDNTTVSAGGVITIKGTDLDLITSVTFGEGSTPVTDFTSQSETSITLTVPMDAVSGAPTFTMANGLSVTGPSLNIEEAVFCYVTEWPDEDHTPEAGSTATVSVKNGDKLTNVYVDGNEVNYVYDAKNSTVTFGLPETTGKTASVRFLSSNGEITYSMSVIPATSVSKTIYTGPQSLTWSDGGRIYIDASNFEGVPAGAKMVVKFTQSDAWGQAQFNNAGWKVLSIEDLNNSGYLTTDIVGDKSATEYSITLTQSVLDNILANRAWAGDGTAHSEDCGMIIQGSDWTINSISLEWENSLETTIWSGTCSLGSWSGALQDLSWGKYDWSTVSAGTVLTVYFTEESSTYWQLRIGNGSWAALPDTPASEIAMTEGQTSYSYTLTANDIAELNSAGGMVLCGAFLTITKVTLQ